MADDLVAFRLALAERLRCGEPFDAPGRAELAALPPTPAAEVGRCTAATKAGRRCRKPAAAGRPCPRHGGPPYAEPERRDYPTPGP